MSPRSLSRLDFRSLDLLSQQLDYFWSLLSPCSSFYPSNEPGFMDYLHVQLSTGETGTVRDIHNESN